MIGGVGKGPAEYLYVADCLFDEDRKVILILDSQKRIVLTYDADGNFVSYFQVIGFPHKFYRKKDALFYITPNEGKNRNEFPNIYKSDLEGKVLAQLRFANNYSQNRYASFSSYLYKDSLMFWQQTTDTIYSISDDLIAVPRNVIIDKELMPKEILLSKERENNFQKYLVIDDIFETDKFFLFDGLNKRQGAAIYHSKSNGENFNLTYHLDVWDQGFYNDLDAGPPFMPNGKIDEKTLFQTIPASKFLKAYNNSYTRGILPKSSTMHSAVANLVQRLKPEDNPIIQIIYCK